MYYLPESRAFHFVLGDDPSFLILSFCGSYLKTRIFSSCLFVGLSLNRQYSYDTRMIRVYHVYIVRACRASSDIYYLAVQYSTVQHSTAQRRQPAQAATQARADQTVTTMARGQSWLEPACRRARGQLAVFSKRRNINLPAQLLSTKYEVFNKRCDVRYPIPGKFGDTCYR